MSKADMIFDAIVEGDLDELQKQLKVDPLLVNASGRDNLSPLHIAAREDQAEIALWLITHGADLQAIDGKHGATPLGWAAYYGKIEMVKTLLDAGADPSHQNRYGLTPYQVAEEGVQRKWPDSVATPKDYRQVMALLHEHGAAPTPKAP